MILFSICDLSSWAWLLLFWLLPFLIGLLLGYLLWYKYKEELEQVRQDLNSAHLEIENLRAALKKCEARSQDLTNESALLQAQIRELKSKISTNSDQGFEQKMVSKPISDQSESRKSAASSTTLYSVLKSDNLQVIEGIGPKMESILKEKGLSNWHDVAQKSPNELRALLDTYGTKYRIIDPSTWSEQAKLAADGKWEDLMLRQKQLSGGSQDSANPSDSKVEKLLIKLGVLKRWKKDDLKAIEGIGPKIEGILKKAGLTTWQQLASKKADDIQDILDAAGDRFRLADPTTWPKQAKLAADGKWKELEEYQDFLNGGREK